MMTSGSITSYEGKLKYVKNLTHLPGGRRAVDRETGRQGWILNCRTNPALQLSGRNPN